MSIIFFIVNKLTIPNIILILLITKSVVNGDWGLGIGDWGLGIERSPCLRSALRTSRYLRELAARQKSLHFEDRTLDCKATIATVARGNASGGTMRRADAHPTRPTLRGPGSAANGTRTDGSIDDRDACHADYQFDFRWFRAHLSRMVTTGRREHLERPS